MMQAPQCQTHNRLLLDLALGRLDDGDAERAEAVRTSCASCSAWWSQHFENDGAELVRAAVADGLRSFRAPQQRHQQRWWAIAAAAVLALAVGLLWQLFPGQLPDPMTASSASPNQIVAGSSGETTMLITAFSFEPEEDAGHLLVRQQPAAGSKSSPYQNGQPIFTGNFEDGALAGWTPAT